MQLPPKNMKSGKWWTDGAILVTGCTKVSPGCLHCWSETMHKNRDWDFDKVVFHEDRLKRLAAGGKPKVFAIWNDLFHPQIQPGDQWKTLAACVKGINHQHFILTKRARNMKMAVDEVVTLEPYSVLPRHIWLGVTVETQGYLFRRGCLLETRASRRFLSIEPILGRIDLGSLDGIDWVTVGCESGPDRRIGQDTVDDIRHVVEQCQRANVPCWVKAVPYAKDGVHVKASKNMNQWPADLRVRQLPV